jgi:outer membrane protein TolC
MTTQPYVARPTLAPPRWRRTALACLLSSAVAAAMPGAAMAGETRCPGADAVGEPEVPVGSAVAARRHLGALVAASLERSQALGAVRLLAEAAAADVDEARAGAGVQAGLAAGLVPTYTAPAGVPARSALPGTASLSVSQLVYDGGRTGLLVDWRRGLADAARHAENGAADQVALATVLEALELSRVDALGRLWQQHAQTMACLVQSLEAIVSADRGRASELVQARKTADEVELARRDIESLRRQVQLRLRKLVGEVPVDPAGLLQALPPSPPVEALLAEADRAAEIAQLDAQAAALSRYAEAVDALRRPQVSWVVAGQVQADTSRLSGNDRVSGITLGLNVSLPLLAPAVAPAADAARRRAGAAQAQRDEALEQRRSRIGEAHEQMRAAAERAERVLAVLERSDQVRQATRQQWQQLGRRSLFDVIASESEHHALRLARVNALHDAQQLAASARALGRGIAPLLSADAGAE